MPRWKCLTCGYETEAADAPEACPVCGAERSQFAPRNRYLLRLARDILDTFRMHPVAAHVPTGAFPLAVLLLLLADVTRNPFPERVSFLLLAVTVLVVPVILVAGFRDWKVRYRGLRVPIFRWKIVLATVLLGVGTAAVLVRWLLPGVADRSHPLHAPYVVVLFSMMGLVVLLGHFGGKLVFDWKKMPKGGRS